MTYGSLFSGIGGLDLAIEATTGARPIWQAEMEPWCRAVLAKHWPGVRCYNDVREIDEHAERPDIICGGFPCQDISNAGKRAGIDGKRSGLWSEFARIVRTLRPRYVFVENVAALVNRGLERVLGDLAALGFDAEWDVFRASDIGAPHRRERLFLLAYAGGGRWEQGIGNPHAREPDPVGQGPLDDPMRGRHGRAKEEIQAGRDAAFDASDVANTNDAGRERARPAQPAGRVGDAESAWPGENVGDAERIGGSARRAEPADREQRRPWLVDAGHIFPPGPGAIDGWDGPQPAVRRGPHGIPGRVGQLSALGNAVVPQQAALAFRVLAERAGA